MTAAGATKRLWLAGLLLWAVLGLSIGTCSRASRQSGSSGTSGDGFREYAQECSARVGPVPSFDCMTGEVVAVTVDGGRVPAAYTPQMDCDRPALLPPGAGEKTDGQCVPFSRVLLLQNDEARQIQATCRKKLIRAEDSPLFDEIDVIAHNVVDGATCWFQAKVDNKSGDPARGLDGRKVPSPTLSSTPPGYPAAASFWQAPARTAQESCGTCHDSDPFYYSPWIAQTSALPADPFGRYHNDIGPMKAWPRPLALNPRDNTCTSCHRIGSQHTCSAGMYQSIDPAKVKNLDSWGRQYPQSMWMPADNIHTQAEWTLIYPPAVTQLAGCCADPTRPECRSVPVADWKQ
jgi:hypothetical protein